MEIHIKEKKYGNRVQLKDVHLSFPRGKMTLIIGTSGAGKSTLIKCMLQSTRFDGYLKNYSKEQIAFIPQHPALNKSETAFQSIYWSARFAHLSAPREQLLRQTEAQVAEIGLGRVKDHKIRNLSGGQMQRVAIARELIRGKNIIIADEIDTGLDCGVAFSLIDRLRHITHESGKTTIVISHNLVNVELYDYIVVLVKNDLGIGQVAYAGPPVYAKNHFEVQNYVDILMRVNSQDEGGAGLADTFIRRFQQRGIGI